MYNNDFCPTKLPERSYLNLPNAIAFQRDLEQTIAKRALCLSLSSEELSRMDSNCNNSTNDSNTNSQNRKVILRPRVILDGDLLDPSIFTPSSDNLENDSGVGSLQARIRDSVVSAPSPSPVTCNPRRERDVSDGGAREGYKFCNLNFKLNCGYFQGKISTKDL
ncbi:unnamed protein product [Onchocerca ochengi]|uniref:Uncharacterized protein n=1 Tax=Onchocerca ochengi TaxID=42157 RepID=A0A182ELU7_ONCOC|nr:unnamed protein product [Onchocerca ochengi]VDM93043.1 unnamed protein product [Onchocerca ochengi]